MKYLFLIALASAASASAFTTEGGPWPGGLVAFETKVPPYDEIAAAQFAQWATHTNRTQLSARGVTTDSYGSSDGRNSVVWSADAPNFGYIFPSNVLAVTVVNYINNVIREADVVVNSAQGWSSYTGPLTSPIWDIGRVLLHEFGHCIGLGHSNQIAIMSPYISDLWQLTADDVAGAESLYGIAPPLTPIVLHSSTGQSAIWYLSNNIFASGVLAPALPANWKLVEVADFDGDGQSDYLLYNSRTRQTAIWYLDNNGAVLSGKYGPVLPLNWSL